MTLPQRFGSNRTHAFSAGELPRHELRRHSDQSQNDPVLSVVMSTYNRGALLRDAMESVLSQDANATPLFEFIVVDNNSTDGTRDLVRDRAASDLRLRYVFEPQQGLSYARNAGIRAARGRLVAFTDDDVRAAPDWVASIVRAFEEHPEADVVGGRVLPIWPSPPPPWLTRDHWAPLALADHGSAPIAVTEHRPICLMGACLACRASVFEAVGLFDTAVQRVRDGIGSLEDHEFLLRVLRTGRTGVYDPRVIVHAEVQPDRLRPSYHRRWHTGHGHFHARLRSEHMERSALGTLLGVPAHLYRQAVRDCLCWIRASATGQNVDAFARELRLRFFGGFARTRVRDFARHPMRARTELWRRLPVRLRV